MALPPLHYQIWNFTKAVAKHAVDGLKNVDEETFDKRIEQCQGCEELNKSRCNQCGCYVDWKALWASEDCPLDKWGGG